MRVSLPRRGPRFSPAGLRLPAPRGAGRGEEELRTCGGRRGTAGNSALWAGGRRGATVEADPVAGAEGVSGGVDQRETEEIDADSDAQAVESERFRGGCAAISGGPLSVAPARPIFAREHRVAWTTPGRGTGHGKNIAKTFPHRWIRSNSLSTQDRSDRAQSSTEGPTKVADERVLAH